MALTHAPAEFRDVFQVALKTKLRLLPNVDVLDFFWVTRGELAGTDIEVYEWDKEQAEQADLFVAILDHPSIGLGIEIMIREQSGKPTLYFAETDTRVSRMIHGLIEQTKNQLHRYETVDDIVEVVARKLQDLRA
jgi:hypothetical protein